MESKGYNRQGELFNRSELFGNFKGENKEVFIKKELIINWQQRIYTYQKKLFHGFDSEVNQFSMFPEEKDLLIQNLKILELTCLPINFWKSSEKYHDGPAIYFVTDTLKDGKSNIVLYIGETISANTRWKGEHDCKKYIENYQESLTLNQIKSKINIRFSLDVPKKTKARRKLEQTLIQNWLPPFNKESRHYWQTPFI
tara:strand:+ start:5822 stop:6415 length:594 start_codon:yes stop_codon:yes gene_type:complete